MSFSIKILGSNSAAPAHNRHQSAQLITIDGHLYLVDCGEGTQTQLARYKVKASRINQIFISHLHGDHFLGLVGLISTMNLFGRTEALHVYSPPGLSEIITLHFRYSESILNFHLELHELRSEQSEVIFEDKRIIVTAIPMLHRVPCYGFLFKEKPGKRRIDRSTFGSEPSPLQIGSLLRGEDVLNEDGSILYRSEDHTLPPKSARMYAYCTDTLYNEALVDQIKGVNLLYHEATFLTEHLHRAQQTFHSTAKQAAEIAVKAQVNRLVLGHYSTRYKEIEPILEEAKSIFPNSILAIEGEDIDIEN